jgi:hypothetical protein
VNRILTPTALALTIGLAQPATAEPTDADVDRMTTYAVILGRAMGCGVSVSGPAGRVGAWMDRIFTDNDEKARMVTIFTQGVLHHATLQSEGRSPDSCPEAVRGYNETPWP